MKKHLNQRLVLKVKQTFATEIIRKTIRKKLIRFWALILWMTKLKIFMKIKTKLKDQMHME